MMASEDDPIDSESRDELPAENAAVEAEPSLEAEEPGPLLATIPLPDTDDETVLEACPACGAAITVSELPPLTIIRCPDCRRPLQARRQFNHYSLLDFLGEGGMGSVYRAVDCNLNRQLALKILKRECGANAGERARLEHEARITASINHPHVVKVYSFGEAQHQFYLAMELVEKGSLDELLTLQGRVAEAQVLELAIQIAEGLEAALARGLIHRDIKPANILFAAPHVAKLVDFGLAIVMEEEAQTRGEIWGTPYYVAPEKLERQPEDFRSDIYSFGGTLFHALSGRPPYDASTASLIALKQLKSQPVSLQSFAPDVSSETSYVINRMLSKDPADRYQSYQELIAHLTYARDKLLDRTRSPLKPRERVVLETQATKTVSAVLPISLLAGLLAAATAVFIFRDRIPALQQKPVEIAAPAPAAASETSFRAAAATLARGQPLEARAALAQLGELNGTPQPLRNWIRMNGALATLLTGDDDAAAREFAAINATGAYSTAPDESRLASFFVEASRLLADPRKAIPASVSRLYSNETFEAFGLLCFGFHDWSMGAYAEAEGLFQAFEAARIPAAFSWMDDFRNLAGPYRQDCRLLAAIEADVPRATDRQSATALLARVRKARAEVKTGRRISARLEAIEKQLAALTAPS